MRNGAQLRCPYARHLESRRAELTTRLDISVPLVVGQFSPSLGFYIYSGRSCVRDRPETTSGRISSMSSMVVALLIYITNFKPYVLWACGISAYCKLAPYIHWAAWGVRGGLIRLVGRPIFPHTAGYLPVI